MSAYSKQGRMLEIKVIKIYVTLTVNDSINKVTFKQINIKVEYTDFNRVYKQVMKVLKFGEERCSLSPFRLS